MKSFAVTLLATAAMIGAAQASEMEDYTYCLREEAGTYLDDKGVDESFIKSALSVAGAKCGLLESNARYENGPTAVFNAQDEVEKDLRLAYGLTKAAKKIERVSGFTPSQSWMMYNARIGYLCRLPLDSEPMRQLVDSGRLELARQKTGCVIVEQPIEVEEVRRWGSTMEVRYVNAKGQLVEAYTSDWTFRTQSGWNSIGIE